MPIAPHTDIKWPTDEWSIPILLLDKQATAPISLATKHGTVKRGVRIRQTLHFYTDDTKFSALWENPMPIVLSEPPNLIEVNYSTEPGESRAQVLYKIYMKRWLSRFWQDYDIPIFVDLNIEREFFDLALMGVPSGWTAYANRAYSNDTNHLFEAYTLAWKHAGSNPIYIVYGGGEAVRQICNQQGWTWLPEDSDTVRGKYGTGQQAQPNTTL